MNKLTKEQAEWLIEKIKSQSYKQEHRFGHNDSEINTVIEIHDAQNILNQCTEKEFPTFKMCWKDKDYGRCEINVALYQGEIHMLSVDDDGDRTALYFPYEQFKQFIQGGNKIVEWLDEKDN